MAKRKYRPALTPGVVRTLPKNALFPARKHIETENAFLADCREKWISSPGGYLKELKAWAQTAGKLGDRTAAEYSQAVLDGVAGLVGCLNGTPRKAATAGILLGLAAERLRAYLEAPYVVQVKTITQTLGSAAFQYDGGTRKEVLARVDELQAEGKHIGSIERTIKAEFGISRRTLLNWRKDRQES